MILAKLMPTLATSMVPAAARSAAISTAAPCRNISRMEVSVLSGGGADHLQHVVHGGLVLGRFVADRVEQRLQLRKVVGGQRLHGSAERGPVTHQLFGKV